MQKIPVSFDYKGKHYNGTLDEVNGGGANMWHLTINKYHYGSLMYTDKWVFHSNKNEMKELAELFGEQVTLWYE